MSTSRHLTALSGFVTPAELTDPLIDVSAEPVMIDASPNTPVQWNGKNITVFGRNLTRSDLLSFPETAGIALAVLVALYLIIRQK